MSRTKKNKKRKNKGGNHEGSSVVDAGRTAVANTSSTKKNPLLEEQRAFFRVATSQTERESFFDADAVTPARRAELWAAQADLGERLINQYAWATPDVRALRILQQFAPIVEVGCGANAYWCRQMEAAGVDCLGYDASPDRGGTILTEDDGHQSNKQTNPPRQSVFRVRKGGPEVLSRHADRTLFLCYPDEEQTSIQQQEEQDDVPVNTSMAADCLKYYTGDCIIHVGEMLATGGALAQNDQAPWGRSSSAEFQERLAAEFHCVLCVELPNWLHTMDRLTVWKRSKTTTIVFAADEDEDESDEEVEYRHIPVEERLPVNIAAPYLQHLLVTTTTVIKGDDERPIDNDKKTDSIPTDREEKRKDPNKKAKRTIEVDQQKESSTIPMVSSSTMENSESKGKDTKSARKAKKKRQKTSHDATGKQAVPKETVYSCPW